MSHIESITFDKFRIFDAEYKMDLRPITFLVGPNSSGKSSVLKSLLLLKSNYSSSLQVLDFTGDKHNLATFANTINKSFRTDEDEMISFSLSAKLRYDESFYQGSLLKEPITTKRSVFNILREYNDGTQSGIKLSLFYRKLERSGRLAKLILSFDNDEKPLLVLNIAKDENDHHTMTLDAGHMKKDTSLYKMFFGYVVSKGKEKLSKLDKSKRVYSTPSKFNLQEGGKESFYDEPVLVFSRLFGLFLTENFNTDKAVPAYFYKYPIRLILQDFAAILENTEYIEAVRANTKRLYTNDSQGTGFNELILDYNSRDVSQRSIEFINKWLLAFDIADEIIWDNVEGVATTIYLRSGRELVALADLGYGITQFLPILLKIALEQPIVKSSKKERTAQIVKKLILLEEPETNLHPKLQSMLADFIADAIRTFEVRFIIETHSEYIIRRLQILTSLGTVKDNESSIYYFNSERTALATGEKIRKINILANGALTQDFGEGFFDEATKMKFELLRNKSQG